MDLLPVTEKSVDPADKAGRRALLTAPSLESAARWILPGILIATGLAYAATLALGFVFDDHILILTNDAIRSWSYFPTYFSSHIWSYRYPHMLANYYRPLFLIWLRLNYLVFGLRAWGWHLTSLLAHVGATWLVYRLAARLTGSEWVAGVAGLIFGLHPIHVEAVADVTSIQEPLSTVFIIAAFLAFLRGREPASGARWRIASLVLAAAALLSKESGMILPVLVGGFVWIDSGCRGPTGFGDNAPRLSGQGQLDSNSLCPPGGEGLGGRGTEAAAEAAGSAARLVRALQASIPFWAVVAAYLPLRIWALKGFAHPVAPLPLFAEILSIPSVLAFYLRLLVWPSGLSCYYDTPYIYRAGWHDLWLPLLVLVAVAGAFLAWYVRTRRSNPREAKTIAFAAFWMVATLVPVLNFSVLPRGEIAHDRYVYLPSVGFVLLIGVALAGAKRRVAGRWGWPVWASRAALGGALLFVVLAGFDTARQSLFWSDDLTLNYRAHQMAPHNVYATTSLAAAVAGRGMDGPAMELYRQVLAVQPNFWTANVNLAYMCYSHGDFPEAARYFVRAVAADPTDGEQFLYLGMADLHLGRLEDAERAVRTALLTRPNGKNYHLGLAMVLKAEGKLAEAQQELAAELARDPENAQAKALLGEIMRTAQGERGKPVQSSHGGEASGH